ncbi:hypothetical protein ACI3L3_16815 [Desulfobaculum sp. SPO524]|uniref:hypothetical protein n=1 Tax=Desulfobaculum sp. SPO524 TaxID=3378071 RepID=UPI0038546641
MKCNFILYALVYLIFVFAGFGCSGNKTTDDFIKETISNNFEDKGEFILLSSYPILADQKKAFIANVNFTGQGRNFSQVALLIFEESKHAEEMGCSYATPINEELVEMVSSASGQGTYELERRLSYYDSGHWTSIHTAHSSSNEGYGCCPPNGVGCDVKVIESNWYYREDRFTGKQKLLETTSILSYNLNYDDEISNKKKEVSCKIFIIDGRSIKQTETVLNSTAQ